MNVQPEFVGRDQGASRREETHRASTRKHWPDVLVSSGVPCQKPHCEKRRTEKLFGTEQPSRLQAGAFVRTSVPARLIAEQLRPEPVIHCGVARMPDCNTSAPSAGSWRGLFRAPKRRWWKSRAALDSDAMNDHIHPEIRAWLFNPSHPVALAIVIVAMLAAIAAQALAR